MLFLLIPARERNCFDEMPFVRRDLSISRARRDGAGRALIANPVWQEDREKALEIVNHWKLCHAFPLQVIKMTLLRWAKKVDIEAVIAQRTKRLPSIESKRRREPNMHLSQMHDIGGCRAVVDNADQIDELHSLYQNIIEEGKASGQEFVKPYDYITNPKADGYRGIHLIYKYRANAEHNECYNGLRVEVQIRSSFQHAWATAVETVSLFIGQELKFHTINSPWKRFFALMSSAIALWEDRPLVPGTPTNREDIGVELRKLADELDIENKFDGWGAATEQLITIPHDSLFFAYGGQRAKNRHRKRVHQKAGPRGFHGSCQARKGNFRRF